MKGSRWKSYLFWTALAEGVGVLSGWLTRDGMRLFKAEMRKPPLTPPSLVFPIVWAVLFALMGIGAARVAQAPASRARTWGLGLFGLQLFFNGVWGLLFFNLRSYGLAFFWLIALWGLIFGMTRSFQRVSPWAAGLQAPYLIWTAFAGYLNLGVWVLNG